MFLGGQRAAVLGGEDSGDTSDIVVSELCPTRGMDSWEEEWASWDQSCFP